MERLTVVKFCEVNTLLKWGVKKKAFGCGHAACQPGDGMLGQASAEVSEATKMGDVSTMGKMKNPIGATARNAVVAAVSRSAGDRFGPRRLHA